MSDENIEVSKKERKPTERSAANPASTLEESIQFVDEFFKNFRSVFTKRDMVLGVIKESTVRDIAAAGHYALLARVGDEYKVSPLYISISQWTTEIEKRKGLLDAFGSPKLYNDLVEKYDGGELPSQLPAILSRFHGISTNSANGVAEIFITNAKYVGVLDDKNVLNYKQALLRLSYPNKSIVEDIAEDDKPTDGITASVTPITAPHTFYGGGDPVPSPKQPLLLNEVNVEEKLTIKLSEKKIAYLLYPTGLNEKDIKILKMQIDALELTL